MKKVLMCVIIAMATGLGAQAQDHNAYFASYKRKHTETELQSFKDLHVGMTKALYVSHRTFALNAMLDQIGRRTQDGKGVICTDPSTGRTAFICYFDDAKTLDIIEHWSSIMDGPAGKFQTMGWKSGEKLGEQSWFWRYAHDGEQFQGFDIGSYTGVDFLEGTCFLHTSDFCGNPTCLIKRPPVVTAKKNDDDCCKYRRPAPKKDYADICEIKSFTGPKKVRRGENAILTWATEGECINTFKMDDGNKTVVLTGNSFVTAPIDRSRQTFLLTYVDPVTNARLTKSLEVRSVTWGHRNLPWIIPTGVAVVYGVLCEVNHLTKKNSNDPGALNSAVGTGTGFNPVIVW